jgi:hypothetical protein
MSDPRLTAADVSMYAEWLNDERWDGQTAMRFVDSHEAYRADVDRLTAERDALREERDALNRILTTARGPKAGRRTAEKRSIITQLMDLERELADARAETKEPR